MGSLTLPEAQKITKEWVNTKGFKWSAYVEYCHLVEEVGELGEALTVKLEERDAGEGSHAKADHTDLNEEIGDTLFSILTIANRFGIDIEKSFRNTISRYDGKMKKYK